MITKIPSVRFVFDRKKVATRSSAAKRRKGLVQIEILYNRKRKFIGTGIKVFRDQWEPRKERHVVASAYSDEYNDILERQMKSVLDSIKEQVDSGVIDIMKLCGKTSDERISVSECSERILANKVSVTDSTRRTYSVFQASFDKFGKFGDVSEVTCDTIAEYERMLISDGISPSTRRIRMHHLHMVLRYALKEGFIKSDPMDGYTMPRGKTKEIVYLTDEEIAQVAQAKLPDELLISRDLFLFQCYTGMAWADLATLDGSMVQTQQAATYINRSRQKTHVQYRTKLLTPALEIVERHGGKIPMPENYKTYYDDLHSITEIIGIKKKLNSHVGRHTFATWALSHGTPIEIVSKMLGHTDIKTTQIYAKVLAKDVEAQFDKLDELFKDKGE